MDDRQFDRWTQALTERLSRRNLSRLGAAALGSVGICLAAATETDAKKQRDTRRGHQRRDRGDHRDQDQRAGKLSAEKKKKGKKKKKPAPPRCTPNCVGKTCGASDDCGGTCQSGSCTGGDVCQDGRCVQQCSSPNRLCGTACVNTQSSTSHCGFCNNACNEDQFCQEGFCRTKPCSFARNEAAKVMTLEGNCETRESIIVPNEWTLDGNNKTISLKGSLAEFTSQAGILAGPGAATIRNVKISGAGLSGPCGADASALIRFADAAGSIQDVDLSGFSDGDDFSNFKFCGTGIAVDGSRATQVAIVRANVQAVHTAIDVDGVSATVDQCTIDADIFTSVGISVHRGSAIVTGNRVVGVKDAAIRFWDGATGTVGPNNSMNCGIAVSLEGIGTDVTVKDNSDIYASAGVYVTDGATGTIRDNQMGATGIGILVANPAPGVIIDGNGIETFGTAGIQIVSQGAETVTAWVKNNTITGPGEGFGTAGIWLAGDIAHATIEDNVVQDTAFVGIIVAGGDVGTIATIRRNRVMRAGWGVVTQNPGAQATVSENIVTDADAGAYVLLDAAADIIDNTFIGSGGTRTSGVYFERGGSGSVSGNTISKFGCGITLVEGSAGDVTVGTNSFPDPGVGEEQCSS